MPHFLLFEKDKNDLPVHCLDSPPAHCFLVKALSHRCARCCTSSSCFTTSLCLSLSEKISKCVLSSRYHLLSILLISLFLLSHYPQVYSQTWFIKASLLPLNYMHRSDEGLTLETSAFLPFTVANLRFQPSC